MLISLQVDNPTRNKRYQECREGQVCMGKR
jgi:hypothetical protein